MALWGAVCAMRGVGCARLRRAGAGGTERGWETGERRSGEQRVQRETACPLTAASPSVWSVSPLVSSVSPTSKNAPCSHETSIVWLHNHLQPSFIGGLIIYGGIRHFHASSEALFFLLLTS